MAPGSPSGGADPLASGRILEAQAPAKLNLSLEVLGRRPDGYHELHGLMARLAWGDTVRVAYAEGDDDHLTWEVEREVEGGGEREIERAGESELEKEIEVDPGFTGPSNLALKAAAAFRKASGFPERALAIHLVKRIPLASGLGGGSSDAAAVLRLLEGAAGSRALGPGRLAELARSLGADAPFFLAVEPLQVASGIGERLTPWPGTLPGDRALLVNPGLALSTAAVFRRWILTSGSGSSKNLDAVGRIGPPEGAYPCPLGRNDLLRPALELAPELADASDLLARVVPAPLVAGLSGSGPTFWALYGSDEAAAAAKASLGALASAGKPGRPWRILATRIA